MNTNQLEVPFQLFGIECAKGWAPLYDPIIDYIRTANHDPDPTKWWGREPEDCKPTIAQIKEKFGTLRIYVDGSNRFLDGMLHTAEAASARMCELCGAPGTRTRAGGYWIVTLCPEHFETYTKESGGLYKSYTDTRMFTTTGLEIDPDTHQPLTSTERKDT